MRSIILIAGAALAVSACAESGDEANNEMAVENLTVDNLVLNDTMGMDGNIALDGNVAMDPATENAVLNDLTTNDADTNLANGM